VKTLAVVLGVLIGLFAILFGGAFLLIESGEVIVLRTTGADGGTLDTRLWVVDYDGDPWVGNDNPEKSRWVPRVRANPVIEFVRGAATECRRATFVDDPGSLDEVSRRIAEKYRVPLYGSRFIKRLSGFRLESSQGITIRLVPCSAS
jgi:hypothetical protein